MTDHQDRPDIKQRRRVTQLRKDLGLAPVPGHVGTELRRIAPRVSEQVVRVLRHDPACQALSPDGQRLLLSAVARAVDEFARLVEDRPAQAPPVEAMLVEIVRVDGQLEPCRAAVHAAFQTLREVTRILWPQLSQARSFSTQLDLALSRSGAAGPFQTIATNVSRSGIYDWVVTLPVTTHALIKIIARDLVGNISEDVSNAEFAIAGGVGVDPGSVTAFALSPLSPNPVRGQARFDLALPQDARVRLAVYDLQGRERLVLADDLFPAGRHTVDGAMIAAAGLDPGLYFLRMTVPGKNLVRRFLLTN